MPYDPFCTSPVGHILKNSRQRIERSRFIDIHPHPAVYRRLPVITIIMQGKDRRYADNDQKGNSYRPPCFFLNFHIHAILLKVNRSIPFSERCGAKVIIILKIKYRFLLADSNYRLIFAPHLTVRQYPNPWKDG